MIFKKKEFFLLIFLIFLQSCSGGRIGNFLESSFNDLEKISKDENLQNNFVNKKINYKTLYKLTNIEYNYQQKRWGTVEEQLLMNKDFIERIKNISFFFKNIS